jgi:hypothetical protein
MLGREDRAGWLRHIRIPRTNEPVSRQAAKCAKVAKKNGGSHLAVLCALASWRELFFQTTMRRVPSCPDISELASARDLRYTKRGDCKTTKISRTKPVCY